MEKISDIKMLIKDSPEDELPKLIEKYGGDEREGVKKLLVQADKRYSSYLTELKRVDEMLSFERKYEEYEYICGIDEAGRGPLAGPVVAAAVILDTNDPILYVNDSKKLSAKKREELFQEIMERAISVGVGIADEKLIDDINILQADYVAMRKAIDGLDPKPKLCLNDAVIIPDLSIKQVSIVKGDSKSLSIAAASIIAKVTRDRIMAEYDIKYPEYGFAQNKGYGSREHIEAIKKHGPCPIHRRSFIGNFI